MDDVEPTTMVEGQPQLSMTSIEALEDLAPFFASICDNVTRQQAKNHSNFARQKSQSRASFEAMNYINSILEQDFLEPLPARMVMANPSNSASSANLDSVGTSQGTGV